MIRGAETIGGVGGIPCMVDVREEMRGGRARESELERMKGLGAGDGMRVRGEVISGPRGFWGWRNVGRSGKEEFAGKVAKGSVWIESLGAA
jgi:hypothetical protein